MLRTCFPDPLDAVLFDLDGTLVDLRGLPWLATRQVLASLGVRGERFVPPPVPGTTERAYWEVLRERFELEPPVDELLAARTRFLQEELHEVILRPLPGVEEVLRQLEAHHVTRVVLTQAPRAELDAILAACGLARWFRMSFSVHDDLGERPPFASLHAEAARHFGFDPRRCVAVEDTILGVRAALAASMFVVAVPSEDPTALDYTRAHIRVSSLRLIAPAFGAA